MAFIQIDFYSNALGMHTHANIILPQKPFKCPDTPNTIAQTCPVLYLLHGQSDDETAWTRLSSIERYAQRLGWAADYAHHAPCLVHRFIAGKLFYLRCPGIACRVPQFFSAAE